MKEDPRVGDNSCDIYIENKLKRLNAEHRKKSDKATLNLRQLNTLFFFKSAQKVMDFIVSFSYINCITTSRIAIFKRTVLRQAETENFLHS